MSEQDAITPLTSGAEHSPALQKSEGSSRAFSARIAQLVEQRIENPRVGGSNPPPGTIIFPGHEIVFETRFRREPFLVRHRFYQVIK